MEEDPSQKYVVFSNRLDNSLKELRESNDYKEASMGDSISLETFTMLAQWVSLNSDDLYHYTKTGQSWYEFKDKNNIRHEIRLEKGVGDRYEIKLWWWNEKTNKPSYDPPATYGNFKYDTRIFNTHIYILLNELIPYFFKNFTRWNIILTATDKLRYRLYRITLNNHLDKTKYELKDLGNNILTVNLKEKEN